MVCKAAGAFVFEPPVKPPVGSVLYDEHLKRTDRSHIADFAGYLMPLWYSSIAAEHAAVRTAAGIFDCTHMGVLEVGGKDAEGFLNVVATNHVHAIPPGAAQYNYILDAAGNVLDDIIIYRRSQDNFMVVVNAANEPKIKAYLAALLAGKTMVDANDASMHLPFRPGIRDMRDTATGSDCRVDIALQGPASVEVLCKLGIRRPAVEELKSFHFIETKLAGADCIIARTGYTGAKVCFELFIHPGKAAELWRKLIDGGAIPCGLGARDSLRIEAGLPLYGHELDGPYNITPFEAGYGWAVKLDKKFFIGKSAMQAAANHKMQIARLEFPSGRGIRPVRQGDAVLDNSGFCVGWVTSCATAGTRQVALGYIEKGKALEGDAAGVYYLARSASQKAKGRLQNAAEGQRMDADVTGKVLTRFEKF